MKKVASKWGKFVVTATVFFVVAGCATVSYTSKAMSVSMGMTKDQVLALMGPPKRVSARNNNEKVIETLSWWSPAFVGFTPIDNEMLSTDRVFVRFSNGKVIEWGDKYDLSDTMEKSRETQVEVMKNLPKPEHQVEVNINNKP